MKHIVSFRKALVSASLAVFALGAVVAHAHAEEKAKPAAPALNAPAFLVVNHKVKDFDAWKPAFESTSSLKRTFGWKRSTVYSVDGDRNNVTVIEEFNTLEGAKAFSQLADLKAAMQKGGVIGVPDVHFAAAVAQAQN